MAKVFNVEQLRINGRLLTGNGSQLYYDSIQLAQGGQAVPSERSITAGTALEFSTGNDTEDLSDDRTINVLIDDSTIKSYATAQGGIAAESLYVNEITYTHMSPDVAGSGLTGPGTSPLNIVQGSGIQVNDADVQIKAHGIVRGMMADDVIGNDQLDSITESNKIQGSAVQLGDGTIENDNGLQVKDNVIGKEHLKTNVAGEGLAGGNDAALAVGAGSGIHVDANNVNINQGGTIASPAGVITSMINEDAVTNDKLATVTEANKVEGGAVSLYGTTLAAHDVGTKGLYVKGSGITSREIHPDVAGAGLGGGGTDGANSNRPMFVNAGSGINVGGTTTDDLVHIDEDGVVGSMIADGVVTNTHFSSVAGDRLSISKTTIDAGAGLALSTDTLSVGAAANGGITVNSDDIECDTSVVRTSASYNQILYGDYRFDKEVRFDSNVLVTGNLEIRGDTILTQSNEVNIGDSIIVLNDDYPTAGTNPPNAGIEIERGAADGGSNGSKNAKLLFDDDRTVNSAADTWVAGKGTNLYQIHTTDFSRSYSVELASGVTQHKLAFGHTFAEVPNVVVSLQHTGGYSVSNADLLGSLVTKLYTTGIFVDFSAALPNSGYFLNAYASTI